MFTTVLFILYNLIIFPIFFLLANIAILFHSKVRRGLLGRYRTNHIKKDFSQQRSESLPLLLIHCASMGEFEHIKPFIKSFKQQVQQSQIVVMFFSPSGYENVKQFPGVDLFIYTPLDWWLLVLRTYKLLKPSALIIAKHDIWPNQIWVAHLLEIPCILINASLHSSSKRLKPVSRILHKIIYDKISQIIAISETASKNFQKLVSPEKITVAGDTKFEQVILRMEESKKRKILPADILTNKKVIVAGSVWPEDEEQLIPAIKTLEDKYKDLVLIACPHEPTDSHIDRLKEKLFPISHCLFSNIGNYLGESVIIIDRIGLLANLYSIAFVAYVGGSFKQNIHNVLEPAVYGVPVIFGPVNQNSREAQLLKMSGGGIEIHNSLEIEDAFTRFLSDDFYQKKIGTLARKVVMDNTGATHRTIEAILPFLRSRDDDT